MSGKSKMKIEIDSPADKLRFPGEELASPTSDKAADDVQFPAMEVEEMTDEHLLATDEEIKTHVEARRKSSLLAKIAGAVVGIVDGAAGGDGSGSGTRSRASSKGRRKSKGGSRKPSMDMTVPLDHCFGSADDQARFRAVYRAAKEGSLLDMFVLAQMYEKGTDGVICDVGEAIFWYSRGAESDSSMAFSLGLLHYTGHSGRTKSNYPEAQHWFKKAAEKSHFVAAFYLGVMHYLGEGNEKGPNRDECFIWTRSSAKLGCDNAMNNLALIYLYGLGVKMDHKRAAKWMKRAASSGCAAATFNLALFNKKGIGMPKDEGAGDRIIGEMIANNMMKLELARECYNDECPLLDRGILPPMKLATKVSTFS